MSVSKAKEKNLKKQGSRQSLPFAKARGLSDAKANEIPLVEKFLYGYRNREDVTTLPPGVMGPGSQNVLTNTFQRVGVRKGYTLDGQRDSSGAPILGAFDWLRHTADTRNLRSGFNTTGSNGKVQYRYVAAAGDRWSGNVFTAGQVYWIDLLTGMADANFNFTPFYDSITEIKSFLLMANSQTQVYEWSGGVTTLASVSNSAGVIGTVASAPTAGGAGYTAGDILTITGGGGTGGQVSVVSVGGGGTVTAVSLRVPGTGYAAGAGNATTGGTGAGATINITAVVTGYIQKTGTKTWAQEGFYNSTSGRAVMINGNRYTYTGGESTLYITGISPSAAGEPLQSVIHQAVITTASSGISGLPATFQIKLISTLSNQVFYGGVNTNTFYVSRVGNYKDVTQSVTRKPGEGVQVTIDGVPTAFQPQKDSMFISAGKDLWYSTALQLSADTLNQAFIVNPLKTSALQAAQSQALTTKIKNVVAFVSFEVNINTLGTEENYLNDPQVIDISNSIINDVNAYDFTDGGAAYSRNYLYIAVPKAGIVRIYNMTDSQNFYWEAPQIMPISRFSIINGEVYGHAYNSSNTYRLFSGYNDDGRPMSAVATFSFENSGVRTLWKNSNVLYVEGYISSNTTLTATLQRDMGGSAVTIDLPILGTDTTIVPPPADDVSLGKNELGKNSLGGSATFTSPTDTPPKFRVKKTYTRGPYFEEQKSFSSYGVDQQWELIAFGTNAQLASEKPTQIQQ